MLIYCNADLPHSYNYLGKKKTNTQAVICLILLCLGKYMLVDPETLDIFHGMHIEL